MKVLVATDAWHPQVNGVVHTLGHVAREGRALGAELEFLSPDQFWTLPMPSYPEIRLALVGPHDVERRLDAVRPDAIHIATEGPIGHAMRRVCVRARLTFHHQLSYAFPGLSRRTAAGAGALDERADLGLASPFPCTRRNGHGGDADAGL